MKKISELRAPAEMVEIRGYESGMIKFYPVNHLLRVLCSDNKLSPSQI